MPAVLPTLGTTLQRRTFQPEAWPSKKTVDIGRNGISVSADPLGGIYQISSKIENPSYAMMIAAPWQQFDQRDRQRPLIVREYRKNMEKRLQSRQAGLGLRLCVPNGPVVVNHVADSRGNQVQIEYQALRQDLFVQTTLKVQDHGQIIQAHQVTNTGSKTHEIPVRLDLSFAVSRASYGQLTDQGEVAMPEPSNLVMIHTGASQNPISSIENASLGARLSVHMFFYNNTHNQYISVDRQLFPCPGKDETPPSRLWKQKKHEQIIRIGPSETISLICVLRPEDILHTEDGMPIAASALSSFSNFLDGDHIASPRTFGNNLVAQKLFVHDGIVDPREILRRHLMALTGVNPDSKLDTIESTILFSNVNYIIGCCSLPIKTPDSQSCAVIPDHIALPLGWPRDNYWQMRLLSMFCRSCSEGLFQRRDSHHEDKAWEYYIHSLSILEGHLRWLFEVAKVEADVHEEARHFWRRSYLINGQPKDASVYQLDTQLYPFLQLCEYCNNDATVEQQPANKELVESLIKTKTFSNVLVDLLSRQDPATGLFLTDETPADDDTSDYPFHLSSNILAWHTLRKLAGLLGDTRGLPQAVIDPRHLTRVADKVFDGILENLVCRCQDGSGELIFAYGLDPSRPKDDPTRHRHYHDGNDIPTLFALEWGFLDPGRMMCPTIHNLELRRVWEKTMTWAFTPGPKWTIDPITRSRTPGYNSGYAGNGTEPFHGLGSDHSDGAWVLGFFQEWKFAKLVGDAVREGRAWAKIQGSMQWDGTFSEAVDVYDGQCTSKTWFSWPGAMIAAELIGTVIDQAHKHTGQRG
ncbi:hypothetical protein N0V93_002005 [Gnomoniopsis smithogilvyi]|uniref:Uncharacterized protein n=1 Tax=Gnomoniopsis smithogilvyi TaxID=1191159 RepID=A0A9W8Z4U9_9PEZI|nr:hypothetical protein N0V93_002005 [Gnomoniopsis smithogilvyi]